MESYDDPAKTLSRTEILNMVKNFIYSTHIDPKKIKAVCLESPQVLEIKQVYKPAGLLMSNITVIEKIPKVAQQIESLNLGVNVINSTDLEFFNTTHRGPFHIISLDYKGVKSEEVMASIEQIAARQLLTSPGILIVNNVTQRERKDIQLFLKACFLGTSSTKEYLSGQSDLERLIDPRSYQQQMMDIFKNKKAPEPNEVDIKASRDHFTLMVLNTMKAGENSIFHFKNFELCYPGSEEISKRLKEQVEKENLPVKSPDTTFSFIHVDMMIKHIMNLFGMKYNMVAKLFYQALSVYLAHGYVATNLARYKYVSINGTPMEMDIFIFKKYDRTYRKIKDIFIFRKTINGRFIFDLNLKSSWVRKKPRKLLPILDTHLQELNQGIIFYSKNIPERILLGMSSKMLQAKNTELAKLPEIKPPDSDKLVPKDVKETKKRKKEKKKTKAEINLKPKIHPDSANDSITKEQAIDLLKSGCSPKEIAECFSGFSARSLSAIQAHITMGTYDNNQDASK
jgi:hypothetical protein